MTEDIYVELTEQTLKPVYGITLTDEETTTFNSKVGGRPYLPKGESLPEDMIFLAQINFAEIPNNRELPKEGILQFFIRNDDTYGMFSENGFKVIFHENPEASVEAMPIDTDDSPIIMSGKMNFNKYMEPISYSDYRFPLEVDDSVTAYEDLDGSGSKLLGYPFFTQFDPRGVDAKAQRYDTLLLQLDSDDKFLMWGDMGVANFFINKKSLQNGDFSDILYNWDCC